MSPILNQHQNATPTDASFLADAVARAADRREQAAAWNTLWENTGRVIAQRIKGQFGSAVPDDFVDHAAGVIYEKLARGLYDWRQGTFGSWCFTVLHRHAISLYHQAKRSATSLDAMPVEPAGKPDEVTAGADEMPAVGALLRTLREALDTLASRDELVSQVNYFAVLLLELRRGLVTRLQGRGILPGLSGLFPQWAGKADSAIISELLPWQPAESALRIRAVYPTIGALWASVAPEVDREPYDLSVDVLRLHIRTPAGVALTGDAWFNWKRHLRKRLTGLVDQRTWDGVFAPWF